MLARIWHDEEGILTFEWILLLTILVIGVIGGLAAVRDALQHEMAGLAGGLLSLDQSYSISSPLTPVIGNAFNPADTVCATSGGVASAFFDSAKFGVWRTDGTAPQIVMSANACGL